MTEQFVLEILSRITEDESTKKLLLDCLMGAKNAVYYSLQVRLSDVIIVSLLSSKKGSYIQNLKYASWIAVKHAGYLSQFVFLYRLFTGLIRRQSKNLDNSQSLKQWQTFACGAFSCLLTYRGGNSPDKMQLFFFLLARILSGLSSLMAARFLGSDESKSSKSPWWVFPLLFSSAGGLSLWLFEHHSKHLTPNLRASMRYLYKSR